MSYLAPAVLAATQVITFLAGETDAVGVSEISRGTELNKNMVFRILNSLEQQGWVRCFEQKYSLTLVPFQVTSQVLSRMSLNNAAAPAVQALWKQTGESTYLGVLKGDKVTYLQHFDGVHDVRVAGRVGGEYELYCSAPGKVLLAWAEDGIVERYLQQPLCRRTSKTLTEPEALRAELVRVRERGYATDEEEFGNGITCVAAPVFDHTGKAVGTVGCSAFTVNGDCAGVIERLLPVVRTAAEEISVCLGYV